MNDLNTLDPLDHRLATTRALVRRCTVGSPPDIAQLRRRQTRRRSAVVSVLGACSLVGALAIFATRRDTPAPAADPQGVGTKIGNTPWRLMLMPDGWTGALIDDDTTAINSPDGQTIELSAEPGLRPPTDHPIVVGPLADGYSTGSTVYVERMDWTLEVAIPGGGQIDPDVAVWLLQSIGRVDIVAPFDDTPLPANIPDVVGMDYEAATEVLFKAGVRVEWFATIVASGPFGVVVEQARSIDRLLLGVAAPFVDFEQSYRYEGGFQFFDDAYVQHKWELDDRPFSSRPPLVFLGGEIVGGYRSWGPNGYGGFQPVQEFNESITSEDGPPETIAVAVSEAPSPSEQAPSPISDADVSYQGLSLIDVRGWTVIDERDGGPDNAGCPPDNTIVLRRRSLIPATTECTGEFGSTLPANWLVIEPLPEDLGGIQRGCSSSFTSYDEVSWVKHCERVSYFPTNVTDPDLPWSNSSFVFFDGLDVLVSAGGNGVSLASQLRYADGHSADIDAVQPGKQDVALDDLDALRNGGAGCAALALRGDIDFDVRTCESVGPVRGTVINDRGVQDTHINPQPDAQGTMITLDHQGLEEHYLLAHRYVWNPKTLAGEWQIVSIERYLGPWPPPAQLPGRPPTVANQG